MNAVERLLWSIALPGFGQLLNGHIIKGIIFITLEILVNVQANFNEAIRYSFLGEIEASFQVVNYQWLMFYPCLYFFAMWDAFKHAGGGKSPFAFLPFVFSAFFVTTGLLISAKVEIYGISPGPIWLPILFVIPGILTGTILKYILIKFIPAKD